MKDDSKATSGRWLNKIGFDYVGVNDYMIDIAGGCDATEDGPEPWSESLCIDLYNGCIWFANSRDGGHDGDCPKVHMDIETRGGVRRLCKGLGIKLRENLK